jgi:seryl-tRNA synthetase
MLSEEKKTKVMSEREEIIEQFTKTTAEWLALKADSDSAKEILSKEREEMAKELENNYWRLDPYIRSTTYYHRVGALTRQGDVDFKAAR